MIATGLLVRTFSNLCVNLFFFENAKFSLQVIIYNVFKSAELLTGALDSFREKCVDGTEANVASPEYNALSIRSRFPFVWNAWSLIFH